MSLRGLPIGGETTEAISQEIYIPEIAALLRIKCGVARNDRNGIFFGTKKKKQENRVQSSTSTTIFSFFLLRAGMFEEAKRKKVTIRSPIDMGR